MIRKFQKILDFIIKTYYNVIKIVIKVSKKQYFYYKNNNKGWEKWKIMKE